MNPEELDLLLRQTAPASSSRPGPAVDLGSSVMRRLGRRERWQDVCLVLGGATVVAFTLALAIACLGTPASGSRPALRLFQEQPASHPFSVP